MEHFFKTQQEGNKKPSRYTVELDEVTYMWLESQSDKYNQSVSQMAAEAIREYFSDDIYDSSQR